MLMMVCMYKDAHTHSWASSALSRLHLSSVNMNDLDLMAGLWPSTALSTYRDSHILSPLSAFLAYPIPHHLRVIFH